MNYQKKQGVGVSPQGFSMIEVLVVSGVMGIVLFGFSNFFISSQKEIKRIVQRSLMNDIRESIKLILKDSEKCEFNVVKGGLGTQLTFNAGGIPPLGSANPELLNPLVEVSTLREGKTAIAPKLIEKDHSPSPQEPGLIITKIYLSRWKRLPAVGGNLFSTSLFVAVESNSGPMAPMEIAGVYVRTSGAGPLKTLEACALGNIPAAGVSFYGITGVYIKKFGNTSEGSAVCCDNGPKDIVLSGDWSSKPGDKATFSNRDMNNHCIHFFEGDDLYAPPQPAATVELLCGSIPE